MPINMMERVKRLAPVGSPLWLSYFLVKRSIQAIQNPSSVQEVRWHVVHQNILLEPYKSIYIPIPKVACSTIKRICAQLLGMQIPSDDVAETIHLLHFPSVKKYRITRDYSDYFKFAIVRNPWSRLVSCYNDKIAYERGHVYERFDNPFVAYLKEMGVWTEDMSFERFVNVISEIPDSSAEAHFRSQHTFLTDHNESLLVDFCGRVEQLDTDFGVIADRMGIHADVPRIRAGKSGDHRTYYTAETARLVAKRYERDIDLLKYTFD
jgi:chondroitin 4-sulfotransferase 11